LKTNTNLFTCRNLPVFRVTPLYPVVSLFFCYPPQSLPQSRGLAVASVVCAAGPNRPVTGRRADRDVAHPIPKSPQRASAKSRVLAGPPAR